MSTGGLKVNQKKKKKTLIAIKIQIRAGNISSGMTTV